VNAIVRFSCPIPNEVPVSVRSWKDSISKTGKEHANDGCLVGSKVGGGVCVFVGTNVGTLVGLNVG